MRSKLSLLVIAFVACFPLRSACQAFQSEFISFAAARPILQGFSQSLPAGLASSPLDESLWSAWVQTNDREIRQRLDRGAEDTFTNLLRFGVSFTKEYRIDDEYLARYGQSSLVDSFAENRVKDLIRALTAPNPPERIIEMRAFLQTRGFILKTPQQRAKVKEYLLGNLARMRDDFLKYRAQPKDEHRFQLFQDRGISLDTNLWPNYQLDLHFRSMVQKGLLVPGGVHRIAIVGPGLDFANKEAGADFYPPQTTQPFAVLDSLVRLGIADPANVEIYTLDISPEVNLHIAHARQEAALGHPYIVQLAWNTARPMSDEYREKFTDYWQQLGKKIGSAVVSIPVPNGIGAIRNRAVRIPPAIVRQVIPLDINIVYQRLAPGPDFDLVIGTNIFIYYGAFEQSLARANIAAMLRPGGFLLSNDKLPDTVPSSLNDVLETPVVSSLEPRIWDVVFCYQREK